ncbi:homospermidine synthase [Patescibacteria group bacterium]|nr:homospermidine synthase [Patescibacteria group bacterium]
MEEKKQNGKTDTLATGVTVATNGANGFSGEKELYTKVPFPGKLLILGCGSIGQCILPMLLRHTDIVPERMRIIASEDRGKAVAEQFGIEFVIETLTQDNYVSVFKKQLSAGDFLLNLSVEVSSNDLIVWCQKNNVLYVDTSTERWPGFSLDASLTPEQRTNYAQREEFLKLKEKYKDGSTAIVNHGANPGIISHFIKAALLDIALSVGNGAAAIGTPTDRTGWANLMQALKVRVIQTAERDTQDTPVSKQPDEFVNTWSVDGFLSEATQPVELGWGTHEKELPQDAHEHTIGRKAAIYLDRPGALTPVRSWTPREGPYHGFLITHDESITTADYYTVFDEQGNAVYRPTMMYAYHPCDDAVLSLREYAGNNWRQPKKKRILMDEIERGADELGVLLMGHKKRSYWYGSDLSIAQARELVPHQNATVMQVAAGALAGVIWTLENPRRGIVEPEDLDFRRILDLATPYLGIVHGKYTNWTPLRARKDPLFPEDTAADPWQFKNFRVM